MGCPGQNPKSRKMVVCVYMGQCFSALMLLVMWQEGHPASKET